MYRTGMYRDRFAQATLWSISNHKRQECNAISVTDGAAPPCFAAPQSQILHILQHLQALANWEGHGLIQTHLHAKSTLRGRYAPIATPSGVPVRITAPG